MKVHMLTTIDNPYDPFEQWDEWYAWDLRSGYNTPGYLARVVKTSSDLSNADEHKDIEAAIDEIVELNVLGVYRKVSRDIEEG